MDDTTSPKFEIKWNVSVGDIVKITKYDYDAYGTSVYGVVLKREETNQIFMFPAVEVLFFKTREVQWCAAGTVEVLSHAR